MLFPLGFAGMAIVYYPLLLKSGTLNPNADSIGIPILSSLAVAVAITPVVLVITAACLWRYSGGATLLIWDRGRPYRSVIVTGLFGIPAVIVMISIAFDIFQLMPWYEYLWDLSAANLVTWLLMLRGAALAKRTT